MWALLGCRHGAVSYNAPNSFLQPHFVSNLFSALHFILFVQAHCSLFLEAQQNSSFCNKQQKKTVKVFFWHLSQVRRSLTPPLQNDDTCGSGRKQKSTERKRFCKLGKDKSFVMPKKKKKKIWHNCN